MILRPLKKFFRVFGNKIAASGVPAAIWGGYAALIKQLISGVVNLDLKLISMPYKL
jgi:hypothetical protein